MISWPEPMEKKRRANSSRFASAEKDLKELKLELKKINSDISDLHKKWNVSVSVQRTQVNATT